MPLRPSLLGLLAAGALLAPAAARAADLDDSFSYAEAPQEVSVAQTKVEFGTGWYVRGDIAATRLPGMDLNTSLYSPPSVKLKDSSQYGYSASLGAGYSFNNWFRADAVFDFHKPIAVKAAGSQHSATAYSHLDSYGYPYTTYSGTCQTGYAAIGNDSSYNYETPYYSSCSSQNEAKIQSFDVLVNGYVDLGHFGPVTPYVGAGAGLSFGHYSSAVAYYLSDGTPYNTYFPLPGTSNVNVHGYLDRRQTSNYYNFAFALMAGAAFDIYPHTKLDIGYRYLNLGSVLGTTLQYHEARAGLRYMIDN